MFDIKEHSLQKGQELSLSPGFHVIFHVVWLFNTNEDVTKNNWLWKFEMMEFVLVKLKA